MSATKTFKSPTVSLMELTKAHDPLFWLEESAFWSRDARRHVARGAAPRAAYCARNAVRTLGQALFPADGVYVPVPFVEGLHDTEVKP